MEETPKEKKQGERLNMIAGRGEKDEIFREA